MIEKIYKAPIIPIISIGILISAFLFYSLLNYADEGNLVMVVIIGIAIGIVAIFITRAINYQRYKNLLDK